MTAEHEKMSTILIVDDTPGNVSLLEAVLSTDHTVRTATRGREALALVRDMPPDLILLDIMMPEMNGYEVCRRLKSDPLTQDIPVIFLSFLDTTEVKLQGFAAGAVDYITKPFQSSEVKARVRTHLTIRELQLRLENHNLLLKQANADLNRLAMIVDSSNDAIFSVSTDDLISSWNRGAENIFGCSARDIIGSPVFTIMPGESAAEKSLAWQTILSGNCLHYVEATRSNKDDSRMHVAITASPLLNEEWILVGTAVIARDVTERRKMEEAVRHQAHHDTLTTLPNRQYFMDVLSLCLAQARRSNKMLALMFLDLNGFKQINDTLGHNCGDRLLQEVARRLKSSIRESDTVARLGGDEFTVLMPDLVQSVDVQIVLKKILGAFETSFDLDGIDVHSSTSIGICIFPRDGDTSEELMKKADAAMYDAKGTGRNSYRFCNASKEAI